MRGLCLLVVTLILSALDPDGEEYRLPKNFKELRRLTAVLGQPTLYSRLWHGVPKDHGDTVRGAKMGSKYRLSELNSWLLSHPQAATFTAAKVCVQIRFGFGSNREVIQLFWFCLMTCHRRYNS